MAYTGVHVLLGIKGVGDIQLPRRVRHQLHQSHGAFAGDCVGIEVGFNLDNRTHEVGIQVMPCRRLLNRGIHLLLRVPAPAERETGRRARRAPRILQYLVHLGRCRARCPHTGVRHRFEAMLPRTPVHQRATGWRPSLALTDRPGFRCGFVDPYPPSILVGCSRERPRVVGTFSCLHW